MTLSDSAWSNAEGLRSQAGFIIAAVDKKLMTDRWGDFSLLRWKSYKQDRRTPSTLGAEMIALSRAIPESRWVRSMWLEANYFDYSMVENDRWEQKVPLCAVVDNKPLFDHVNSQVNTIEYEHQG